MKPIIQGWVNYFSIALASPDMKQLDEFVRTRLRMGLWKEWKNKETRIKNLLKLKVNRQKVPERGCGSNSYCRMAHTPLLLTALNNAYFRKEGYEGFYNTYKYLTQTQTPLF